jgi:hypothetical protein
MKRGLHIVHSKLAWWIGPRPPLAEIAQTAMGRAAGVLWAGATTCGGGA